MQYGTKFLQDVQSSCVTGSGSEQTGHGSTSSSSPVRSALRTTCSIWRLYFASIWSQYSGRTRTEAKSCADDLRPARWHSTTVDVRMPTTCDGEHLQVLRHADQHAGAAQVVLLLHQDLGENVAVQQHEVVLELAGDLDTAHREVLVRVEQDAVRDLVVAQFLLLAGGDDGRDGGLFKVLQRHLQPEDVARFRGNADGIGHEEELSGEQRVLLCLANMVTHAILKPSVVSLRRMTNA
eukprot:TRINITY_DN3106_c0_g1_i6.p2 TRINITY_DN3106_c0_g1~~TRINITY_DN3106_c0_g1_i6.p2  ORF type:complete len:237 (-),score=32.04 TRINITY_DN3106_c0_g1_i6:200-910(-)